MWINLTLLTIYTFNGRTSFTAILFESLAGSES